MKIILLALTILTSVSAFSKEIVCYKSQAKIAACGFYEDNPQTRSCRLDVYGRDAKDYPEVLSVYADGTYIASTYKAVEFMRVKKLERQLKKQIHSQIEELKKTLPQCEF
jgi:hypothetical protein